jgi:hypothetical protein
MKFRNVVFTLIVCAVMATLFLGMAEAQAPATGAAPAKAPAKAPAAASRVPGNLAQVMRGILFPNVNVIYFAQGTDPAKVKPAQDPSTAVDPLAGQFGGWSAVENSGLALSESVSLITMPGRLCSNGKPAPVADPDYRKFAQELRTAGDAAYKAAQAKSTDKIGDAADAVTTACSDCHMKYRDVPGGIKDRCTSSK